MYIRCYDTFKWLCTMYFHILYEGLKINFDTVWLVYLVALMNLLCSVNKQVLRILICNWTNDDFIFRVVWCFRCFGVGVVSFSSISVSFFDVCGAPLDVVGPTSLEEVVFRFPACYSCVTWKLKDVDFSNFLDHRRLQCSTEHDPVQRSWSPWALRCPASCRISSRCASWRTSLH